MVSGHESVEYRLECKMQAARKLHEAICALEDVAAGMGMTGLAERIAGSQKELYGSGELSPSE